MIDICFELNSKKDNAIFPFVEAPNPAIFLPLDISLLIHDLTISFCSLHFFEKFFKESKEQEFFS